MRMDAAANAVAASATCPVNSHNEWDPLEEIIVGRLEGATIPSSHPVVTCNIPGLAARAQSLVAGFRYPAFMIEPAQRELDGFIALLQSLGVTVRRPDPVDYRRKFGAPGWTSHGFCNSCPRDSMLVIGDEIIETPMAWPCRYFETHSYRTILKEYFQKGARWTSAPKPQLTDELFDPDFRLPEKGEPISYILTEFEPVFDAADFFRCGRDIFVTRSNVTNLMGIAWLRRHLGEGYRVHEIESRCPNPMHIDTTILPLGPGKLLVNPEYIDVARLPPILKTWDILIAPEPDPIDSRLLKVTSMCGKWLSMNILMIDETRVIVDPHHKRMMAALKAWGLEPIPCEFLHYAAFGGAFHCATLDIRRRGTLQSYF
ncbi:amidinotransferase [Bradyrhizobium sp. LHD-71]|uniref:amidinotransferase n=1 Tax=Bradyrhizobium sp. LHD-71 TaxID=3072141 RepID=UPI00280EB514|nr:amidinotransferase [Bradyrhizobium sp. LHD-71]MDQ8729665.1 amidinotransferase [Bradyrhizobium sp. LHD-71]